MHYQTDVLFDLALYVGAWIYLFHLLSKSERRRHDGR